MQWKWAGIEPELHTKLSSYKIDDNVRVDFDAEVQSWVDEGILQAVPRDCYVESVVPMMAVVQHVKGKTRPVLDYRALNKHVSNHSGSSNMTSCESGAAWGTMLCYWIYAKHTCKYM